MEELVIKVAENAGAVGARRLEFQDYPQRFKDVIIRSGGIVIVRSVWCLIGVYSGIVEKSTSIS